MTGIEMAGKPAGEGSGEGTLRGGRTGPALTWAELCPRPHPWQLWGEGRSPAGRIVVPVTCLHLCPAAAPEDLCPARDGAGAERPLFPKIAASGQPVPMVDRIWDFVKYACSREQ